MPQLSTMYGRLATIATLRFGRPEQHVVVVDHDAQPAVMHLSLPPPAVGDGRVLEFWELLAGRADPTVEPLREQLLVLRPKPPRTRPHHSHRTDPLGRGDNERHGVGAEQPPTRDGPALMVVEGGADRVIKR